MPVDNSSLRSSHSTTKAKADARKNYGKLGFFSKGPSSLLSANACHIEFTKLVMDQLRQSNPIPEHPTPAQAIESYTWASCRVVKRAPS